MPCKSYDKFIQRMQDVELLRQIHDDYNGKKRGNPGAKAAAANRSAIVIATAAWEAFLEDICLEATDFLKSKAKTPAGIPEGVRNAAQERIQQQKELKYKQWTLSVDSLRRDAIRAAVSNRIKDFNNPLSGPTNELFKKCLGMRTLLDNTTARVKRIDSRIDDRHKIAHGAAIVKVTRASVDKYCEDLISAAALVMKAVSTRVETLLQQDRAEATYLEKGRPGRTKKKSNRGRREKLTPW